MVLLSSTSNNHAPSPLSDSDRTKINRINYSNYFVLNS